MCWGALTFNQLRDGIGLHCYWFLCIAYMCYYFWQTSNIHPLALICSMKILLGICFLCVIFDYWFLCSLLSRGCWFRTSWVTTSSLPVCLLGRKLSLEYTFLPIMPSTWSPGTILLHFWPQQPAGVPGNHWRQFQFFWYGQKQSKLILSLQFHRISRGWSILLFHPRGSNTATIRFLKKKRFWNITHLNSQFWNGMYNFEENHANFQIWSCSFHWETEAGRLLKIVYPEGQCL